MNKRGIKKKCPLKKKNEKKKGRKKRRQTDGKKEKRQTDRRQKVRCYCIGEKKCKRKVGDNRWK